jgi:chromate transporter
MLQRGGGVAGRNSSSVPVGLAAMILWVSVLLATTFIRSDNALYQIFSENYQLGSALLGGGPIVVPLLAARAIQSSLSESQFFQGASMAQSLPGSLFNFAAYVGAMQQGGLGALAAHVGILAPGCILAFALLPLWLELREHRWFRSSLRGVSAAGVGLLASACIATFGTCIQQGSDFMVFLTSGVVLFLTDLPAPIMLIVGAGLGAMLSKLATHQSVS